MRLMHVTALKQWRAINLSRCYSGAAMFSISLWHSRALVGCGDERFVWGAERYASFEQA